jgi:hypothetical protein
MEKFVINKKKKIIEFYTPIPPAQPKQFFDYVFMYSFIISILGAIFYTILYVINVDPISIIANNTARFAIEIYIGMCSLISMLAWYNVDITPYVGLNMFNLRVVVNRS